ncbi:MULTISPECIES: Ger(x)C family spore germination protein [Bacillaceae]|uniref:Spore germination protein KC n=1 Tax=Peribacillus huizhouensis TaxID=1501239 RepID=A0ABR6CTH3_9BACI|nr:MULTISPECIES: Ger(x)C family spore germination protein [Bacillaceae]MBA9028265.1 spore germination protein KC [Peribacillus huizhouensis]
MKCKTFFLSLMISSILFITGCWSQKELNDLAIVSAFAIDKNESEKNKGRYEVTLQVINPGNVAGSLQGGGGQTPPISTYTSTANTILIASRELSKKVSRKRYYAHTNLVVISEKLAREEGITRVLDAIERSPEFRTTAQIVIAHNAKAADIVKILTPIDKISSNDVIKTIKFTEDIWGEVVKVNLQDVIRALVTPGKEPVITGFRILGSKDKGSKLENIQDTKPSGNIDANGIAIFKEGKLIGWFHNKTSRGVSWILNKIKTTAVAVDWEEEKEAIVYNVIRQKTKVKADMEKGSPVISIHTEVEGDIGEVNTSIKLSDRDTLFKIEKSFEKEIKEEIKQAVKQAKKNQSDIFGFGEKVYRANPTEWKNLEQDWNEVHFPKAKIRVSVEAFVRRTGLTKESYISDLENK